MSIDDDASSAAETTVRDGVDVLVVATMRRWVADDFRPSAHRFKIPVLHSWGLDVPDLSAYTAPAWWTPTEHAARLLRAGVNMPLLAPGPEWLSSVPEDLTGRPVWAGPLAELGRAPACGWAKPAEMKVEQLPARCWDDIADFGRSAHAAGLPASSWVQVSPTTLSIQVEYRCFILAGRPVAASPYLLADGTTWFEGMETDPDLDPKSAAAFATDVGTTLGADQPPAYVLDVAHLTNGSWVVLEANPAWSSAAYGADMDGVLATVLAAVDHTGAHRRWRWRPDPWLAQRAAQQRVLPPA